MVPVIAVVIGGFFLLQAKGQVEKKVSVAFWLGIAGSVLAGLIGFTFGPVVSIPLYSTGSQWFYTLLIFASPIAGLLGSFTLKLNPEMGGGLLTLAAVGTVLGYLGPVSAIALPLYDEWCNWSYVHGLCA